MDKNRDLFQEAFVAWCDYFLNSDTLDPSVASALWETTKKKLEHIDALTVNEARQEASHLTPRGRRDVLQLLKVK
jgi:hypothetical protein